MYFTLKLLKTSSLFSLKGNAKQPFDVRLEETNHKQESKFQRDIYYLNFFSVLLWVLALLPSWLYQSILWAYNKDQNAKVKHQQTFCVCVCVGILLLLL